MAKCNLGKVNLEAMLVSSFSSYTGGGPMPLAGVPSDWYTQLLACSSSQSVFAIACCLRAILFFGFSHPSLPRPVNMRRASLLCISEASSLYQAGSDHAFFPHKPAWLSRLAHLINPGEGGYFRNFWVGMCHWDPRTLEPLIYTRATVVQMNFATLY